jgi:ribonuclease-3
VFYRFIYLFSTSKKKVFLKQLCNVLGFIPGTTSLYIAALSHRSIKERATDNNERLEYLGDAILGSIIADHLFMKYPYKGEGFLTEMRSKMVNRQILNDIALKMGLKKITSFNKNDNSLRSSQIFGNALEALVGAVYIDKGYEKTKQWVLKKIILPHLFLEDLENIEINQILKFTISILKNSDLENSENRDLIIKAINDEKRKQLTATDLLLVQQ